MNMQLLLLLSGPVAVGKSSVATSLVEHFGFSRVSTGGYLRNLADARMTGKSREDLQNLGDGLDEKTDFRWVVTATSEFIEDHPTDRLWLLDAVRKRRQVEHFRDTFKNAVFHVHFSAEEDILRSRYEERLRAGGEYVGNTTYEQAIAHPNEIAARDLINIAEEVIDLGLTSSAEAAQKIDAWVNSRGLRG